MTISIDTLAPAEAIPVNVYQAIGGRAAVSAAVDGFYERLLADPVLSGFFPGGVAPWHRAYLITILGEALGGPERYRGPDLARAHGGLGITDADAPGFIAGRGNALLTAANRPVSAAGVPSLHQAVAQVGDGTAVDDGGPVQLDRRAPGQSNDDPTRYDLRG